MNLMVLQELRFISDEIPYADARSLPREVRQWWVNEKQKEIQGKNEEIERIRSGQKTRNV